MRISKRLITLSCAAVQQMNASCFECTEEKKLRLCLFSLENSTNMGEAWGGGGLGGRKKQKTHTRMSDSYVCGICFKEHIVKSVACFLSAIS